MAAPTALLPPRDAVAPTRREVRRRRPVPNGRAVAGGLLVALAALGAFSVAEGGKPARRRYVVAAADVAVGDRLGPGDLTTAPMDLPAALRARVFTRADRLVGATALGPLDKGELIQSGGVVRRRPSTGQELSFAVDTARAIDGDIAPGERIDVLATYGGGSAGAYTAVVGHRVLVSAARSQGGSLGNGRSLVLTVRVASPDDVLALTHAVRSANVTVVRAAAGATTGPRFYRPPAPEAER